MNDPDFLDAVVVGGGISGLACAWGLQKRGWKVVLLEGENRAGGTIGTVRKHGCLLESGPNSTLDTTPLIGRLLDELGISGERIDAAPAARNRYILHRGRLVAMPLSAAAFFSTSLFSTRAKLRLLCEPFIARGRQDEDESVAEFVRRRLGEELLERAINPFVAGVYAGDPETLSVRAAFPKLHQVECVHRSLLLGQWLGARERAAAAEKSKQSATMFAFRDGMQTLTDALVRRLHGVEVETEAVGIEASGHGYLVRTRRGTEHSELRTRVVVLAVPAHAAAGLVAPIAPEASSALSAIVYPPVAVVVSAYRKDGTGRLLDGFGFLVPQSQRRQILGTIFSSTLFEKRAPDGLHLLTTFVGGMRQPDVALRETAAIAEVVQAEHAGILGTAPRAEFVDVQRWRRAIPQYTLGHFTRMARLEQAERDAPGIFFCANYRGGVSIGDCIRSADSTVERAGELLRGA